MLLSKCIIGLNAGPLHLEVLNTSPLTEELLKLELKDASSAKVNIFVEGSDIKFFSELIPGTKIQLSGFTASQSFSQISQYFPTYIPGENVAAHNSDCNFFIPFSPVLPSMVLSFNNAALELNPNSVLENMSLASLYEKKKYVPASSEKIVNDKYCNLRTIHEKVLKSVVFASCYAVVVDCSGSYAPKNSEGSDYLASYKITDSSIFPSYASLNIFHKNPKDIPKVDNIGDIIKLNEVQFAEYGGILQGKISANSKSMSFYVFNYSGSSQTPYITYKSAFHTNPDHSYLIEKQSEWVKITFTSEFPLFMRNTQRLSSLSIPEEADIITRVLGIHKLGVKETDPTVCLCGDESEISQLVIPDDRKKMLKFIEIGNIVRIRSVSYQEKVLYLKPYSDILRVPNEFKGILIPEYTNRDELSKYSRLYSPLPQDKIVSKVSLEYKSYPLASFSKILSFPMGSIIRIEGFIVKIAFSQKIEITLWDGDNETNIIKVRVPEEKTLEFLNGRSWSTIKKDIIGYNYKFQAVVRIEPLGLEILGTFLIN
jgi:Telomeric single stranded DNA binding POT1/CDC13